MDRKVELATPFTLPIFLHGDGVTTTVNTSAPYTEIDITLVTRSVLISQDLSLLTS